MVSRGVRSLQKNCTRFFGLRKSIKIFRDFSGPIPSRFFKAFFGFVRIFRDFQIFLEIVYDF